MLWSVNPCLSPPQIISCHALLSQHLVLPQIHFYLSSMSQVYSLLLELRETLEKCLFPLFVTEKESRTQVTLWSQDAENHNRAVAG